MTVYAGPILLDGDPRVLGESLGAVLRDGQAHFRVWAPRARSVDVVIKSPTPMTRALQRQPDGCFTASLADVPAGALYMYSVDGEGPYPDPCSRFQPDGPHGSSMLVDPSGYGWTDGSWRGVQMQGQVVYEIHIGAFTAEGTFDAACKRLAYLQELGVTVLEVLPIAECPGRWNWGYDGVQLYAPYHMYGPPDALRRFVDRAHQLGLAVILDVVYNHLGPDGNYLQCFSPCYFSKDNRTDWGEGLNFDGEESAGVREFFIANACYWIDEFHFDGFRLDATQSILDSSEPHILAELITRARKQALPRSIIFIAENEPQRGEHLLPAAAGGLGLDAMWNDDFHHSARVALTGSRDGYYCDYSGRSQELLSAIKRGFLFQGQYYSWQKQPRGSPLPDVPAWACVHFIQNHDQVGNTFIGDRLHLIAMPARYRALTALMLLGPQTPLLFMGQEFLSSRRFMFFADHGAELGAAVHAGRKEFMSQFRAYAGESSQALLRDPADESTFLESKLDWSEAESNSHALQLHRSLLQLRAADPVISRQCVESLDGATLSEHSLVLRWFDDIDADRLLIVNLNTEIDARSFAEPLLAPRMGQSWSMLWSSEEARFGGSGAINPVGEKQQWRIAGNCAVLLRCCEASGTRVDA